MFHIADIRPNSGFCAVDGCPSGWVVVWLFERRFIISHITDLNVLKMASLNACYVDMPVELPDNIVNYPRLADKNAKSKLGAFHASIFYAPVKEWLTQSYNDINMACRLAAKPKLSKQSYYLFAKIQQVQSAKAFLPFPLIELHPELLFHYFLDKNKRSKKTLEGLEQRVHVLHSEFNLPFSLELLKQLCLNFKEQFPLARFSMDDILDALMMVSVVDMFENQNKDEYKYRRGDLNERFKIFTRNS